VSDTLPIVCRRLYHIFESAPPSIKADYLLGCRLARPIQCCVVSYALRYPLCRTPDVLDAFLRRSGARPPNATSIVRLPRWLFRRLSPSGEEALPLLRYLYERREPPIYPLPDSHRGFPLACAVKAGAMPLVRFLLGQGASPRAEDALAVRLAIKRRDLDLVRLLIDSSNCSSRKVEVNSDMLKLAVKVGARHIAEFLLNEKGCVPDLEVLRNGELDRCHTPAR
jgi:hypothetical protein